MSLIPSWSFLLDENVDKKLTKALEAAGYPAAHVSDNPLLQAKADFVIFRHACVHQQAIITRDTDYLDAARFPLPHPGIILLRFFNLKTSAEIIRSVVTTLTLLAGQDLTNKVVVIEPDRFYVLP